MPIIVQYIAQVGALKWKISLPRDVEGITSVTIAAMQDNATKISEGNFALKNTRLVRIAYIEASEVSIFSINQLVCNTKGKLR